MKLLSSLSFAALLCAPASLRAEEKTDFKIEWQNGRNYVQTTLMDQLTTIPGQGEMAMKMEIEMGLKVSPGAKEGTKNLKVGYEKMDVKMSMGGNDLPPQNLTELLKDVTFTAVVDAQGKFIRVEGLDSAALAKNPQLAAMLSEKQLETTFNQMGLLAYPMKPMGKGDSWEFSLDLPIPIAKMTMKGTYTHAGEETFEGKKCVVVKMEAAFKTEEAGKAAGPANEEAEKAKKAMEQAGFKIDDGKLTGKLYYDPATKSLARSEAEMDMKMSMKNPQTGEKMEMPSKTKTSTSIRVKEAK